MIETTSFRTFLLLLLAAGAAACSGTARTAPALATAASSQLVIVTTAHWDSTRGTLQRYERNDTGWQAVGTAAPVVVGRNGLAWGVDVDAEGPRKREGDGRAPAGAYPLTRAFGFAAAASTSLPYLELTPTVECVDDRSSWHYNAIVDSKRVLSRDWRSSERMRSIELYRQGVLVDYNPWPATRGGGSCIFLHEWSGPAATTAGCTAMDPEVLRTVIGWLDPRARPLLVQAPRAQYEELRAAHGLPPLD